RVRDRRRQRRRQPSRAQPAGEPDLRDADPGRGQVAERGRDQAVDVPRVRRDRQPAVLRPEDRDAVRRREGCDGEADRGCEDRLSGVPAFPAEQVYAAVSPDRALDAVRQAFVAYARGEWTMPPKVYVPAYPAGDFRAMPALGAGHALLKWVTSFPGNPAQGLP